MAGLSHFVQGLSSFNATIVQKAEGIVNENPEVIADMVKKQLLDGKNKDGSFIGPTMDTDSYFKKPGAWERYAAAKQRKFPSSVRPFNVPNLIFSAPGKYHPGITVYAVDGRIVYPNTSNIADSVQAKFNPDKTMGLTVEHKQEYRNTHLLPRLRKELKQAVYG